MGRAYSDIAFTTAVRAKQTRMGSREQYEALDHVQNRQDRLGVNEIEFIRDADHFYQATVSETDWPYVQHRGGPKGFLKVLDNKTLAYADFTGNVQYISVGNLENNDRISIIIMDYANQLRLKLLGRARTIEATDDPALMERLRDREYGGRIERAVAITIEGYDWNCPQHITPRFTEAEVAAMIAPLQEQLRRLKAELAQQQARPDRIPAGPDGVVARPVTVTLKKSGKVVEVPADRSILDVVQAAGVPAPAACRIGRCGTCAVKVLTGEPEHRDSALSEDQRDQDKLMCICVSRAQSPALTLDL
jgi:predicted pyridoxine 5'-phosphate oxidase superfamily flavin-nucleotide-binding protein/ferredoxin